jgi:hypothetical protein
VLIQFRLNSIILVTVYNPLYIWYVCKIFNFVFILRISNLNRNIEPLKITVIHKYKMHIHFRLESIWFRCLLFLFSATKLYIHLTYIHFTYICIWRLFKTRQTTLKKLMLQGYNKSRLKSSFREFYGHYNGLVCDYKLSLSHMLNDLFHTIC